MKKTILALLLAVAMIATLSLGAFARQYFPGEEIDEEEDLPWCASVIGDYKKINYGTPVVDGSLDEIYKNTLQIKTSELGNVYTLESTDANLVVYVLWDEAYFYFCAVVHDSTIQSQGEDWIFDNINNGGGPWVNDVVELHIAWYGEEDDKSTVQKWGCDAFGYALYTSYGESKYEGYEDAYAVATHDIENQQYIVEFALPNVEGYEVGDSIGFEPQVNDIIDFGGSGGDARYCCHFGIQQPWMFIYEMIDDGKNPHSAERPTRPQEGATEAATGEGSTQGASESATQGATQGATQSATTSANEEGGCGSAVMSTIAVVSMACAAAFVLKKKN